MVKVVEWAYYRFNIILQSTRETLKRHVVEFGDQLGKENEVALIVDGQVTAVKYFITNSMKIRCAIM